MNISRIEFKVTFARETRLRTFTKSVSEVLGLKMLEERTTPIVSRKNDIKFAVRWEYDYCGMVSEDVGNVQECIGRFLSTTESIDNVAPFGKLSARSLRVDWIYPAKRQTDFAQLEMNYRQAFIKQNELFQNVFDSSAMISMRYGSSILHHQSGAMGLSQLQDGWRVFKVRERHPDLFLFLNTRVTNEELTDYSRVDTESFVNDSFELMNSHATSFEKLTEALL